jgi:hypothetical protein
MTMTARERREWVQTLTSQELTLLVAAIIAELHTRGWLAKIEDFEALMDGEDGEGNMRPAHYRGARSRAALEAGNGAPSPPVDFWFLAANGVCTWYPNTDLGRVALWTDAAALVAICPVVKLRIDFA